MFRYALLAILIAVIIYAHFFEGKEEILTPKEKPATVAPAKPPTIVTLPSPAAQIPPDLAMKLRDIQYDINLINTTLVAHSRSMDEIMRTQSQILALLQRTKEPEPEPKPEPKAETKPAKELINWQTSYAVATKLAEEKKRILLIDFSPDSCIECAKLKSNVLSDPKVDEAIREKFVPLVIGDGELAAKFNVDKFPTFVAVSPTGQTKWFNPERTIPEFLEQISNITF